MIIPVPDNPLDFAKRNFMPHPIAPKLTAVFVHVSNLRRAADFYTQLLGLNYDPKEDYGNGIYVIRLANGEDLVLDANHSSQNKDNDAYKLHATCMFGTQDINAAHAWMQSQNIEIVTELYRDP